MKKTIVISGINFFEGGALSIFKDCLSHINGQQYVEKYKIIALVHKLSLFTGTAYKNIIFLEYPKSRRSYLYRLYYEFLHFKKFAKENEVDFWLSLHDITPNVGNIDQAVYCHNPSPFNSINLKDVYLQPIQLLFRLFYKYLYMINIKKNKYVIVQQLWLKYKFQEMFSLKKESLIVALPRIPDESQQPFTGKNEGHDKKIFFFPTYPRPFKNIEVICEAVKKLNMAGVVNFEVIITIDGTENNYAREILRRYRNSESIEFIGTQKREEVFKLYEASDCLVFPSKLETWGLPISEFKMYNKTIFASNLPYARETAGDYNKVVFFDPDNATELAELMENLIEETKIKYATTTATAYPQPFAENWEELFKLLLN
jgi:glycosyltransferase involved in cell wall biosynthesis